MRTIPYATEYQRGQLLTLYHTIGTMRADCKRSRSWAYEMMRKHKGRQVLLQCSRTGQQEKAIPRHLVAAYLMKTRRGNPNWR